MSYGEKIIALRQNKGMTQAELGAELNVTYQAVSKWERDESDPDFATMSKIAKLSTSPSPSLKRKPRPRKRMRMRPRRNPMKNTLRQAQPK